MTIVKITITKITITNKFKLELFHNELKWFDWKIYFDTNLENELKSGKTANFEMNENYKNYNSIIQLQKN